MAHIFWVIKQTWISLITLMFRDILKRVSPTSITKLNNREHLVVADWQSAPGKWVPFVPMVHFMPPLTHSGRLYLITHAQMTWWMLPQAQFTAVKVVSKFLLTFTCSNVTDFVFVFLYHSWRIPYSQCSLRSSLSHSTRNVSCVISLLLLTCLQELITGDANHASDLKSQTTI